MLNPDVTLTIRNYAEWPDHVLCIDGPLLMASQILQSIGTAWANAGGDGSKLHLTLEDRGKYASIEFEGHRELIDNIPLLSVILYPGPDTDTTPYRVTRYTKPNCDYCGVDFQTTGFSRDEPVPLGDKSIRVEGLGALANLSTKRTWRGSGEFWSATSGPQSTYYRAVFEGPVLEKGSCRRCHCSTTRSEQHITVSSVRGKPLTAPIQNLIHSLWTA